MIARANAREILAIDEAIRTVISDAVARRCPEEIAVARAVAIAISGPTEATPAERPSERRRRQNREALAAMAALEGQGKSRAAASIVARHLATDPSDPAEIWMLAQRFRRLRRSRK